MLRISKTKKGFTLLEIIIVVAIIIILASVLALNIGQIISPVKNKNSSVDQSVQDMRGEFSVYESKLSRYNF